MAAPAGTHVVWTAVSGCPNEAYVRGQVDRLLAISSTTPNDFNAQASVHKIGEFFEVTLLTQVQGLRGQRVVRGNTCMEVANATALIIAMSVDPEGVRGVATDPRPLEAKVLTVGSVPSAPWRPVIGGLATAVWGPLPQLAVGAGVSGALRRGWISFEVGGVAATQQTISSPQRPMAAGTTVRLLSAFFAACAVPARRWAVGGCAGALIDDVRGRGFGVTDPVTANAWWPSVFASGRAAVRVAGRLSVVADLSACVAVSAPVLVLEGVGPLHTVGRFALRPQVRLELPF